MIIRLVVNWDTSHRYSVEHWARNSLRWINGPNWSGSSVCRIQFHSGRITRRASERLRSHYATPQCDRASTVAGGSTLRYRRSASARCQLMTSDVTCSGGREIASGRHGHGRRRRRRPLPADDDAFSVGRVVGASKRKMIDCVGALRNGISGEQATSRVYTVDGECPSRSGHQGPPTTSGHRP